jgi:enediyne polyketide synthase
VNGNGPLAADWQLVPDDETETVLRSLGTGWVGLRDQIARLTEEPAHAIAARLWTASECLAKTGRSPRTALTLAGVYDGGWVLLRSGQELIATTAVPASIAPAPAVADQDTSGTLAVALMAKEEDADPQNV